MAKSPPLQSFRRQRGFEPASGLMKDQIRAVGEKRGFAVSRLLTQWGDIVGADLARVTRPVKVGYGREGMGATLTLLVASSEAPVVQMQVPRIRDKVNACYGYAAIARIHLTQTAPSGFAEGQAAFAAAPKAPPATDPALVARATETASGVQDTSLRTALEVLAQNILIRRKA